MPTAKTTNRATKSSEKLTAPVFDVHATELRSVTLDPGLFDVTLNPTLVSETLVSAQENRRHPIANTRTRGMVSGGGRKPWRQKGTGRARTGSIRGPQWRHGGVVFGPSNERTYIRKINQKARQAVVRMLLTGLHEAGELAVIDRLAGELFGTTKHAAAFLNRTAGSSVRPLVLTATADPSLLKSFRNLEGVMVRSLERLGLVDLALTDKLILDTAALEALTNHYAGEAATAAKASEASEADEAQAARASKRTSSKATRTSSKSSRADGVTHA